MIQQLTWITARRLLVLCHRHLTISPSIKSTRLILPCFTTLHRVFISSNSKENLNDKASNIENLIIFFMNHFNMSASDAKDTVLQYEQLHKCPKNKIPDSYNNLLKMGLHNSTVKNNIWLLMHMINPIDTLNKINLVKSINIDINDGISFLTLGMDVLIDTVDFLKDDSKFIAGGNRIHYLAKKLECSIKCACDLVVARKFLRKISFRELDTKLGLLLEFGMSKKSLVRDIMLLSYKEKTLLNRIYKAYYWGVKTPTPWTIRGPEEDLNKSIDKKISCRAVFGSDTKVDYIYQRLEYNKDYLNVIIKKKPAITSVSAEKLKLIFDLMFENNFTPLQISRSPQIFFSKYDKLKERCLELKMFKHQPAGPVVLCLSEQQYRSYINSLIRNGKMIVEQANEQQALI